MTTFNRRPTGSRSEVEDHFYVAGGTLRHDAPSYVERQADRDLFEGLRRGELCYVLTSRQMGKSSLMNRTAARLREEGVAVVVVDLTAIGQNVTVEQWYDGLLGHLGLQLDMEAELEAFSLAHPRLGPLQRWMRALREVLLPRLDDRPPTTDHRPTPSLDVGGRSSVVGRRLVIFIDEIDAVRSLPFSTDEFFAAIRECYNRRTEDPELERLTFCLLGVATPSDLIQDTRTTPFNIGRRIELNDFSEAEAAPLRIGLELGGPETLGRSEPQARALLQRIFFWTGGHPYLTQRLCQAAADAGTTNPKSKIQSPKSIDGLCAELFLSPRSRERDDNLLFVRQRLLRSEVDLAGLLELYEKVRQGKQVEVDDTNQLVSVLRLSGVTRVADDRRPTTDDRRGLAAVVGGRWSVVAPSLAVRNRIYERVFDRRWVRQHMPDAEVRRQRAAYRRGLARAAVLASVIVALVSGLALTAIRQRGIAQEALQGREEANAGLRVSLGKEQAERARADDNARLALESAQANATLARQRADALQEALTQKERADGQTRLAERNAADARGQAERARRNERRAEQETVRARAAGQLAERRAEEAGYNFYVASMNLIQRNWVPGLMGTIRQQLAETRGYRGRGFEWGYWNRLAHLDLLTITAHAGRINSARYSPDGRRIVTGGDDNTAKVWDAATGREILTLKGHTDRVNHVRFSPDGRRIATSSRDHTAKVWDAESGRELLALPHPGAVGETSFSPDSRRIVTASYDEMTAKVWDAESGRELLTLRGHTGALRAVEFSPDGRRIVTGCFDSTAKVWDAESGREILTLKHPDANAAGGIYTASFSPDGRRIVTGGGFGARVWDVESGRELISLRGRVGICWHARYSPDGQRLAMSDGNIAMVMDAESGRELLTLRGHAALVESVSFSPDGRRVLTGSWDGTAQVWDAEIPRETLTLSGHTDKVLAVGISSNGRRIVTGSSDQTAKVWDAATGRELLTLRGHRDRILSVSFSPDGRRILTSSGNYQNSQDNTARVWDAATGRELLALKGHARQVNASFSPDGRRIATSGGDTVKVWDAVTGRELLTIAAPNSAGCIRFSPDGRRLVTVGAVGKVWDAATGQELVTLQGSPDWPFSVTFSPDGRRIVAEDRVLDAASGRVLFTLKGHPLRIYSADYSRDGRRIVTGSWDGTAKVWDAATGRELLTLQGPNGGINPVCFAPEGRRIVTGCRDGTARIWFAEDADWPRPRPLPRAQRANTKG